MLGRYQIVRGARPAGNPLPQGVRQDTRKHTQHVLRPSTELVTAFLANPGAHAFVQFRAGYVALLARRLESERPRFDAIAAQAQSGDVFIGCNCPTSKQPDVNYCHTTLALHFFAEHYPELSVAFP